MLVLPAGDEDSARYDNVELAVSHYGDELRERNKKEMPSPNVTSMCTASVLVVAEKNHQRPGLLFSAGYSRGPNLYFLFFFTTTTTTTAMPFFPSNVHARDEIDRRWTSVSTKASGESK